MKRKPWEEFDPKLRAYVYPYERYWELLQQMANRMAVSEQKYGKAEEAYPDKLQAINSVEARLNLYKETGNTEWLLDAANMCVLEAMFPSHLEAHFRATDSDESPGLQ